MITPEHDTTIEAIATYLCDGLNEKWQGCVMAMSAFDQVPSDPSQYPHLVVHRLDAEGEGLERCKGVVRYLMVAPTEKQRLPGMFRSVQLEIVRLLRNYDPDTLSHAIAHPASFRCRERILGLQNGLLPFLEIEFQFIDLEPV